MLCCAILFSVTSVVEIWGQGSNGSTFLLKNSMEAKKMFDFYWPLKGSSKSANLNNFLCQKSSEYFWFFFICLGKHILLFIFVITITFETLCYVTKILSNFGQLIWNSVKVKSWDVSLEMIMSKIIFPADPCP